MLNCAAIVGRLVADPELHKTNTGVSVCSFTVAVDRSFVRQGEERQADFIDVVARRAMPPAEQEAKERPFISPRPHSPLQTKAISRKFPRTIFRSESFTTYKGGLIHGL